MKTEWYDIIGYEGLYQINTNGVVKSLERFNKDSGRCGRFYKERILKICTDKYGYLQVVLYKNGKSKTFKIHKLVANQFIPNPLKLTSINHIDENKLNNNVCNLEWCTTKYNNNYNNRQLKIAEKRKKKVAKYDKYNNIISIYNSVTEAANSIKGYKGYIIKCCKGSQEFYKNFKWRYYEIS